MHAETTLTATLAALRLRLAGERAQRRPASHVHVLWACAIVFGLRPREILGPHRDARPVEARFAFYWISRHRLGADFSETGRRLNYRHPTTVRTGVDRAAELMRGNARFCARVGEIEALVWPLGFAPPRTPSNAGRPKGGAWRSAEILSAVAAGAETSAEVGRRLGIAAEHAGRMLTRLRAAGLVSAVGRSALARSAGVQLRWRLADSLALPAPRG